MRCIDFYRAWEEKGGPNWCEKAETTVREIDSYFGIVRELEEQGVPRERAFEKLSEGATRALNQAKTSEVRQNAISTLVTALKTGKDPISGKIMKKIRSRDVRRIVHDAKVRATFPVSTPDPHKPKKYRVVYADPPWTYNNAVDMIGIDIAPSQHYPTMTTKQICDMNEEGKLPNIEKNAVLFLWTPPAILPEALEVVKAWEFEPKTNMVWNKVTGSSGYYVKIRHELLLICTRGSCLPDIDEKPPSVITVEKTAHSAKPEEFRRVIDQLYPHGNRIELFAREQVKGWDVWGNQVR